jgi:hypothetical protein
MPGIGFYLFIEYYMYVFLCSTLQVKADMFGLTSFCWLLAFSYHIPINILFEFALKYQNGYLCLLILRSFIASGTDT